MANIARAASNTSDSSLPVLSFPGKVILVQTPEQDLAACDELSREEVVGIDFEWQPDVGKANHPLSLAQVATSTHCYIWCLFAFDTPCTGLMDLLEGDTIKKVGCGFRSNDLKKLELSGYSLPMISDLPEGFEDIQDYEHPVIGLLPWKSLKYLVRVFCGLEYIDKQLDVLKVNWSNIAKDKEMLKYAVLDAYSVLLVHNAHRELEKVQWNNGSSASASRSSASSAQHLIAAAQLTDPAAQGITSHEYALQMATALLSEMRTEMEACRTEIFTISFHSIDSSSRALATDDNLADSVVMRLEGDSAAVHFYHGCQLQLFDNILCEPHDVIMEFEPTLIEGTYFVFDILSDFHRFDIDSDGREYYVKRRFNPVPFQRQLTAIEGWVRGVNPLLERIILGSNETAPADETLHDVERMDEIFSKAHSTHPMNPSQRAAVGFAVSRSFSMIHGPPGTGKSHTLTSLIHYLCATQPEGHRILVCAPSNEATDHLARRLIEALGSSARDTLCVVKSRSRIRHYRRDTIAPYIWTGKGDDPHFPPSHRIVCCTLSMSGGSFLQEQRFKYVIIDEASQCLETECLVAVAHHTQHLILAGDHKQLGPVVLSQEAKDAQLERSLFERLMQTQEANGVQLRIQYRMHPDISAWPNMHFYDSKIEDGVTKKERELHLPIAKILQTKAISFPSPNVFIDIRGVCTKTRLGSSSNKAEEVAALSLFISLTRVGVGKVVILTPYLGQAGEINLAARRLNMKGFNNRSVAYTISQFQGQEADVVILTLVRSLHTVKLRGKVIKEGISNSIGFTADPKRINVGLTRAKKAMFVLGDAALLKNNPLWLSALSHYANMKSIFHGTPSFERTPGLSLSELPSQDINQLSTPTVNHAHGAQDLPIPSAASSQKATVGQTTYSKATKSPAAAKPSRTAATRQNKPELAPENETELVVAPRVSDSKRPKNHKVMDASPNATQGHVVMLQRWLEINNFPNAVITPWRKNREADWNCTLLCADHRFVVTSPNRKTAIYGACFRALGYLDTDFQVLPAPSATSTSKNTNNGSSTSKTQTANIPAVIAPKPAEEVALAMNRYYSLSADMDSIFITETQAEQRSAGVQAAVFGKLPGFTNSAPASAAPSSSSSTQAARTIQPSSTQKATSKPTPAQSTQAPLPTSTSSQPPAPKKTAIEITWNAFCGLCQKNKWTAVSYGFTKQKQSITCALVLHSPTGATVRYNTVASTELDSLHIAMDLTIKNHDLKANSGAVPSQTSAAPNAIAKAAPATTPAPTPAAAPLEPSTQPEVELRWREIVSDCANIGATAPQKAFKGTSAPFTCTVQFKNITGKTVSCSEVANTKLNALSFASLKLFQKEVNSLLCASSPWADTSFSIAVLTGLFNTSLLALGYELDSIAPHPQESGFKYVALVTNPKTFEQLTFTGNGFPQESKAHASASTKALAFIRANRA